MALYGPQNFLRPIGRQPLRPGTYHRLGGINVFPGNNTYIQNNFFGGSSFGVGGGMWGGGFGGGWGYGGDCCGGGGGNKFMNWMMGLGMASMLGGFFCNLFGVGQGGDGGGRTKVSDAPETEYVSTTTQPKTRTADETGDTDDGSAEILKEAAKKSFDNSGISERYGLNDGDVEVAFDENGKTVYRHNGKDYGTLQDLQDALEAAKQAAEAAKKAAEVNNAPENLADDTQTVTTQSSGTGKGKWVNNHYTNGTREEKISLENAKRTAGLPEAMMSRGIMPKGSTPDDVINKFVNTDLQKMGYSQLTPEQSAQLKQQIIKSNPSVYHSDGAIKTDADYTKLDVPSIPYVISQYKLKKTVTPNNDTVSQQKVVEWNKTHPDNLVSVTQGPKNTTYSTTVKFGNATQEIKANSFDELKKKVDEYIAQQKSKQITPQNVGQKTRIGGAAGLSGLLRHKG